jgi:hypothetical protein
LFETSNVRQIDTVARNSYSGLLLIWLLSYQFSVILTTSVKLLGWTDTHGISLRPLTRFNFFLGNQAKKKKVCICIFLLLVCLLARFTLQPWKWKQYVSLAPWQTFTRLHGVTSQKAASLKYISSVRRFWHSCLWFLPPDWPIAELQMFHYDNRCLKTSTFYRKPVIWYIALIKAL